MLFGNRSKGYPYYTLQSVWVDGIRAPVLGGAGSGIYQVHDLGCLAEASSKEDVGGSLEWF